MSVEKLNDELEFAASQGPDTAVMTTQETVRAVLAEVGVIYVLADGGHVTGERAVDLYDDELARCKRVSSELADCRSELDARNKTLAIQRDALLSARGALCAAAIKDGTLAIIDAALSSPNVPDQQRALERTTKPNQ